MSIFAVAAIAAIGVFCFPDESWASTCTWGGGGGTNNWSEVANWTGAAPCTTTGPSATDNVVFNSTSTKNATIDIPFTVDGITIATGYTGTITQSADLTLDNTTGFAHTTTDGTFTAASGTLILTGTGTMTFNVDTDDTFNNVTINKTTATAVTVSSGDSVAINGALTLTDGDVNTGTLLVYGTVTAATTFDGGTGVVELDAGVDFSPPAGSTLPGVRVDGALAEFNGPGSGTVTFEGPITIAVGTFNAGAGILSLQHTFTIQTLGTFNHDNGTIVAASTALRTFAIPVSTSETFYNFTINASSATNGLTLTTTFTLIIEGTLTLTNGLVNGSSADARIRVDGTISHAATFDGGTAIVALNIATPFTPASGGIMPGLELMHASSSFTGLGIATTTSFGGTVITGPGTFNAGAGTISLARGLTVNTSGTFNHDSGTITFAPNTTITTLDVDGTEEFFNLTINGTTAANSIAIAASDVANVNGTLTLTNGELDIADQNNPGKIALYGTWAWAVTFDGGTGSVEFHIPQVLTPAAGDIYPGLIFFDAGSSLTGPGTGTVTLEGVTEIGPGVVTVGAGTLRFDEDLTITDAADFVIGTGTVAFGGTTTSTVDVDSSIAFNALTILKTGGSVVDLGSTDTFTVTGTLTLTSGQLNNNTLYVNGASMVATAFSGGTTLLEVSSTGTAISHTGGTLPSLHIDHAGVVYTGSGTNGVRNLTLDQGTFTATSGTLSIIGDLSIDPAVTFSHNNGTINFSTTAGNAGVGQSKSINGSWTINNLTISIDYGKTFIFESGETFTVEGNATFTTESRGNHKITLQSSIDEVQAIVDFQGGANVGLDNDLRVEDINNIGTTIVCHVRCFDEGNNDGFEIGDVGARVSDYEIVSTEGGPNGTFTVRLEREPTADVTISLTSTNVGEATVSPSSLTFTAANFYQPQTVTVTSVDDGTDDGNQSLSITLGAAVSADVDYSGYQPDDVQVLSVDDDTAAGTFDFDQTAAYNHEDVKDTGSIPILNFVHDYAGIGYFTGAGDVWVDLTGSKIKSGCTVVIDGETFAISGIFDDGSGSEYAEINYIPAVNPEALKLLDLSGAVSTIACTELEETTAGLRSDFVQATYVPAIFDWPFTDIYYDGFNNAIWGEGGLGVGYFDIDTLTLSSIAFGGSQSVVDQKIAYDPTRGNVWWTNMGSDSVTVYADGGYAFGTVGASTFSTCDAPHTATYDATQDAIWIACSTNPGTVYKLNAATGAFISSTNLGTDQSSFNMSGVAHDPSDNSIWVMIDTGGNVVKLDATDGSAFFADIASSTFSTYPYDFGDFIGHARPHYVSSTDEMIVTSNGCDIGGGGETADVLTFLDAETGGFLRSKDIGPCPYQTIFDEASQTLYGTQSFDGAISRFQIERGEWEVLPAVSWDLHAITLDSEGDLWVTELIDDGLYELVFDGTPFNDYYAVTSSDTSQLDVSAATSIDSVDVVETLNGQDIFYAVSFDDRHTFKIFGSWIEIASDETSVHGGVDGDWYYWNGTMWVAADPNTAESALSLAMAADTDNQMTGTELEAVTQAEWEQAGGFDENTTTTLDLAAIFFTDDVHSAPTLESVEFTMSSTTPAGVTITESGGSTDIEEGGATDSYDVVLDTQPTDDVTITITPDAQCGVDDDTLVFTDLDWNVPQTVTVTAIDDDIDEASPHTCTISHTAESLDLDYDAIFIFDVVADVTDDDVSGFTVSAISGDTTEVGGTATFTVVLTSEPVGVVEVDVTSLDLTEGTVGTSTLTFNNTNWDDPTGAHTVTVTGVDDELDDGDILFTVELVVDQTNTTDPNYDPLNPDDVSVTNIDDDTAGFVVSAASNDTDESGTNATFTVRLTSEPSGDVVVLITSFDTTEGTVSTSSLTFDNTNWDDDQTVTVTGQDDDVDDGDITFTVDVAIDMTFTTDPTYDPLNPPDVSVTNLDDDTAGVIVTEIGGTTDVEEGGATDSYTVVLTSEPTSNVTINVTNGVQTDTDLELLTFTSGDWDDPQTVVVSAVDDDIDETDPHLASITHGAESTDLDYDGILVAGVLVSIGDDDESAITVSPISGDTTEAGGTATFSVVLESEPTDTVTIAVSTGDGTEGTPDLSSLEFDNTNWSSSQIVTVTGVDDDVDDGDVLYQIVLEPAESLDLLYNDLDPADVDVVNQDDDEVGVTITQSLGTTEVTEGGGDDTYTVVLDSEPLSDVTVDLSDDEDVNVDDISLTFTSADWDTPQIVTVSAENDDIDEGNPHTGTIDHSASSLDPLYDGISIASVDADVFDDDTAGFIVSAISDDTNEAGGTATFTVVLTSEPTADVTVQLASDDATEGNAAEASLTFTSLNWDIAQEVTVTGEDDDVDDGDVAYLIVLDPADSLDLFYDGEDPDDVSALNLDDDTAGYDVSAISGNTTESGGTATFTVVLTSEPTNDVTIPMSALDGTEISLTVGSLTFTSLNWDEPQEVTVTGEDDDVDDGDVLTAVALESTSSLDSLYDANDPEDVSVTNIDDDGVGVLTTPLSGNTAEDGTQATFTIVLTSEPTADVTIDISSSDLTEGTVSTASVTFTAADWDEPQEVTVTGVNDGADDDDQAYTIILAEADSLDPLYDVIDPSDLPALNEDDDTSGGGGSGSSYTFVSNASVRIQAGVECTESRSVIVILKATNAEEFQISNDPDFADASWMTFTPDVYGPIEYGPNGQRVYSMSVAWELEAVDGEQVVYARFRSVNGSQTSAYEDTIVLDQEHACDAPDEAPEVPETPTDEEPTDEGSEEDGTEVPDETSTEDESAYDSDQFVRTIDDGAVYFVDQDGVLRLFPDLQTYLSFTGLCGVFTYVDQGTIDRAAQGAPLFPRAHSVLVKFAGEAGVYVIADDGVDSGVAVLRLIESEAVAEANFGPNWQNFVVTLRSDQAFDYVDGNSITGYEYELASRELYERAVLNQAVTYDLYIINPDGTKRSAFSEWATITRTPEDTLVYGIEDKGSDADHDDVVIDVDTRDCLTVRISVRPLESAWHHQIGMAVYYEGVLRDDTILWQDSHAAVGQDALVDLSKFVNGRIPAEIVENGGTPSWEDPDVDHDGLTDAEEYLYGTSPVHPDTDGDGFIDGTEVAYGHSPITPDVDGDGLLYDQELVWGTDPGNRDTDGDGYADGIEVSNGYNPLGIGLI